MPQIIRTYRPYTPPAPPSDDAIFLVPATAGSVIKNSTGRPKGYYQPNPARFEALLAIELATNSKLTRDDVMGPRKLAHIVEARRRIAMALYHRHDWSGAQIARVLDRDASTIYHILGTRRSSKYCGLNDL